MSGQSTSQAKSFQTKPVVKPCQTKPIKPCQTKPNREEPCQRNRSQLRLAHPGQTSQAMSTRTKPATPRQRVKPDGSPN